MSKQKISRMESNKIGRRVLGRHQIDLGRCSFSCFGSELLMTGHLCKTDGSEVSGTTIQAIIVDFSRHLPGVSVRGDLDNWKFTNDSIMAVGKKEEKKEDKKEEKKEDKKEEKTQGSPVKAAG